MRSAIRVLLYSVLCVGLSFCSLFSKKEENSEAEANLPKYENYHSSGVYKDIEKASGERAPSSEEYKDDEYGETEGGAASAGDEDLLSESSEPEGADTDPLPNEEPAAQDDPLVAGSDDDEASNEAPSKPAKAKAKKATKAHVAKAKTKEKKESKKVASVAGFKSGMYPVSSNCTMREKPNKNAKSMGTVDAGKKLWMEKHNDEWVKVFKKSGPVYLNKVCL